MNELISSFPKNVHDFIFSYISYTGSSTFEEPVYILRGT